MLVTAWLQLFWWLTIVGGLVKVYSYRMVPNSLAENLGLKTFQVITLSRKMMDGHKWQCFLLDLSFWGWSLFCGEGLLVFGLGGLAVVYILAPLIDDMLNRILQRTLIAVCCVLLAIFAGDQIYS